MMPRDQQSTSRSYVESGKPAPDTTSGAMYCGVPQNALSTVSKLSMMSQKNYIIKIQFII